MPENDVQSIKLPAGYDWFDLTKVRGESLSLLAERSSSYWENLRAALLIFHKEIEPHLGEDSMENRIFSAKADELRGRRLQEELSAEGIYLALFGQFRIIVTIHRWNDTAVFTNGMHRTKAALDIGMRWLPAEVTYSDSDPTDIPLLSRNIVFTAPGEVQIYNDMDSSSMRFVCHNCKLRCQLRPYGSSPHHLIKDSEALDEHIWLHLNSLGRWERFVSACSKKYRRYYRPERRAR